MIDETRYPERIWARRYSHCVVGARERPEPYSPLPDGYPFVEYVRADLYEAESQRAEKAEAALREILKLDPAELAWGTIKSKNIAREALRNDGEK